MTLNEIRLRSRAQGLDIFGAFHPEPDDAAPKDCKTLILLGPHEPGFWDRVTSSPEWASDAPVDTWSKRVIGQLAQDLQATALYPFGGPPYQPFIRWATRSGAAWQSPVSLLVHARAGLMVSYRGALAMRERLDLPPAPTQPCELCAKPCATSCPVGALTTNGYDVAACHAFLDTDDGAECLNHGCRVRRACPVSETYGRLAAQSAYHMSVFHK